MMPDDQFVITDLLEQHLGWYPLMDLQDVYKLLYQGVMGSEHLVTSPEEFSRYFATELESISPDPALRMFEPVRADGALFRLNLRPLKSRLVVIKELTPFLIQSAQVVKGTKSELRHTWELFIQLCRQSVFTRFDIAQLERFTDRLERLDYPAMHHSEKYSQAYQPAYRLIASRFISELGMADGD